MVTTKAGGGQTGSLRLRDFKAALERAGMTQRAFAKAHGVTDVHVLLVARGERQSPRIEAAIAAFISEHETPAAAA